MPALHHAPRVLQPLSLQRDVHHPGPLVQPTQLLKKKSFRQFCEANGLTSSAFRYMSEFEHDHPDIAKQYFDIRFDRHGA